MDEVGAVEQAVFGGENRKWWTLAAISIVYLALMPYGPVKYARIKRRRMQEAHGSAASPDAA